MAYFKAFQEGENGRSWKSDAVGTFEDAVNVIISKFGDRMCNGEKELLRNRGIVELCNEVGYLYIVGYREGKWGKGKCFCKWDV